ncbi:MAG: AI-2E family transporter [Epsilonproteobacteria bacterium]|nr:AI-2E family transporter [Campylobacterota bacterium]
MESDRVKYYFFYLSAFVVIIGGLKMASQAVVILFLAIFIASILSPVLSRLQHYKIPKLIALILVVFMILLILFFVVYIINSSLKDFVNNVPFYEEKLRVLVLDALASLTKLGFEIEPKSILEGFNFGALFNFTAGAAGNIGMFFSKTLLVLIGVAFILVESSNFERKLDIIFKRDKDAQKNFALFSHNIQKYFSIKTLTSLLTGSVITGTLILFDIDYPVLWGFLGFILNFIPVIGSFIASIPALLLSLIHQDLMTTAWLALIYLIINNVISNVLEPKFMGQGLGLSAAVIFFSLIFWGWVLGPVGMFLAVPLTMTLKIACDSSPRTQWIGILLSNLSRKKGL